MLEIENVEHLAYFKYLNQSNKLQPKIKISTSNLSNLRVFIIETSDEIFIRVKNLSNFKRTVYDKLTLLLL